MSIFINYSKEKCAVCNKKFYPKYCMICRLRDFVTCTECHKHTKHHRTEESKLAK
jgi:hypothetical protein